MVTSYNTILRKHVFINKSVNNSIYQYVYQKNKYIIRRDNKTFTYFVNDIIFEKIIFWSFEELDSVVVVNMCTN
jgi:hypothetical protein